MSWAQREGLPYPLGVSRCEDGAFNFAVYSKHATELRLLLFDSVERTSPTLELSLDPLVHKSGRVWHYRLTEAELAGCRYYAYVADGPESVPPFEIHAFHRDKWLVDPYARRIAFPAAFSREAASCNGSNAGRAPLGEIVVDVLPLASARPIPHETDALIYELHVRGFTRHSTSGVGEPARGTYAGVIAKIPYLRELGVTIVELMPVFQTDPQGRDIWGYMPLGFFAPQASYAATGQDSIAAFREMVDALHAAGIEVVIDVVYNHTTEDGATGPIYSFKGLDNSTYYLVRDGGYANYSGCGNSLNASNRYVRKMILDSMRYWHDLGVDGFRFDLASVFARDARGKLSFDDPPIFGDVSSAPELDRVRMIAEPWDAAGAYELGRAFPGISWLQWNSRFRDELRRFVRGDAGMTGALMRRVYGSDDLFPDDVIDAYHAFQSVNHLTSHDGFTLYDLLSYTNKRNADGAVENFSSNHGWEGDEGAPPEVVALRERQAKNLIALLMLSNGTPMLRAGDEMLHTQRGHNNPYDQDNETWWIDWSRRDRFAGFWRFVQQMIALRKRASIGRSRFWRDDVRWHGPNGVVDLAAPQLAWSLRGGEQELYVMVNAGLEPTAFVIQETGDNWAIVVDTACASPGDIEIEHPRKLERASHVVAARSLAVLSR